MAEISQALLDSVHRRELLLPAFQAAKVRLLSGATFVLLSLLLLGTGTFAQAEPGYVGVQAVGLTRWGDNDVKVLADLMRTQSRGRNVEVSVLPFTFQPKTDKAIKRLDNLIQRSFAAKDKSGRVSKLQAANFRLTLHLWFDHGSPHKEYTLDSNGKTTAFEHTFRWSVFDKLVDTSAKKWKVVTPAEAGLDAVEQLFVSELQRRVTVLTHWHASIQSWLGETRSKKLQLVICPELEDTYASDDITTYRKCLFWLSRSFAGNVKYRRCIGGENDLRPDSWPLERHGRFDELSTNLNNGDIFSNDGCGVTLLAKTVPGIQSDEGDQTCAFDNMSSGMNSEVFLGYVADHINPSGKNHYSFLLWRAAYNKNPDDSSGIPRSRKEMHPFTSKVLWGGITRGKAEASFVQKVLNPGN